MLIILFPIWAGIKKEKLSRKGGQVIVNSKHFVKDHLGLDIIQAISVSIHKVWTNQNPENLALSLAKSDRLASFSKIKKQTKNKNSLIILII